MAKEPERRYATARDLADDLGRFLDDRPILARRPGVAERLARWSRRHRRATAIAAGLLVLAIARRGRRHGPALARTAADPHGPVRDAGGPAARATGPRSSRSSPRTRSPAGLWPGSPRPAPRMAPAEARRDQVFCRKARDYYEEIAGRYRDDPEMPAIVAAADHRIGFIRTILKEPDAEDAYRRSIALYERLLAASPGARDLREALALTYGDLSLRLRTTGSTASAQRLPRTAGRAARGSRRRLPRRDGITWSA